MYFLPLFFSKNSKHTLTGYEFSDNQLCGIESYF